MTHKITPDRIAFPRTFLAWDGEDFYVVKCDADGHLQMDVVTSGLPTGAAIAANQIPARSGKPIEHKVWTTEIAGDAGLNIIDTGTGHRGVLVASYLKIDGVHGDAKDTAMEVDIDDTGWSSWKLESLFSYFGEGAIVTLPWAKVIEWDDVEDVYSGWIIYNIPYVTRLRVRIMNGDDTNAVTVTSAVLYTDRAIV